MIGDIEKRKSVRHRVRFTIVYDDGVTYNAGHVLDISDGGLYLEGPFPLAIGTRVRLEPLHPVEDALFELLARVVRCEPVSSIDNTVRIAFAFEDIDNSERRDVDAMIDSLERQRRLFKGVRDPFLGILVPVPALPS